MTMVYLANVPSLETDMGIMFYTPNAHVAVDFPTYYNPNYYVVALLGDGDIRNFRNFPHFHQAMDYASRVLKQAEPA